MWGAAFSSEDTNLFSNALAEAWRQLQESGRGSDDALDRAALSRGILKAGELGERSIEVLAAYALVHLEDNKYEMLRQAERGGN